jgi:PKHD-type hydroxylase
MMLKIPDVLTPEHLGVVQQSLAGTAFIDGTQTAGARAAKVKRNEEMNESTALFDRLNEIVMGSLCRHPLFRSGALPLRVARPRYARYRPGMTYGFHIDDPLMGQGQENRSDVSVTIFLSEPRDYDGGELVVRSTFGEQTVKLPAGHAVIYPSSSLHRVSEVTRGERLVAVSWIQSLVRDPSRRELLHELDRVRDELMRTAPDAPATERADQVYANLIRMWAEV